MNSFNISYIFIFFMICNIIVSVKSIVCYLNSSSTIPFVNNECGCGNLPPCNNLFQIHNRIKNEINDLDSLYIYIAINTNYYIQNGNKLDYDSFLQFENLFISSYGELDDQVTFDGTGSNSNFISILNNLNTNIYLSNIDFINWNYLNNDQAIINIDPVQQEKRIEINLNTISFINSSNSLIYVKNNQIDDSVSTSIYLLKCNFTQINTPLISNKSPLNFTNILEVYIQFNNFKNSELESSSFISATSYIVSAHYLQLLSFNVENIQIKDNSQSFLKMNGSNLKLTSGIFNSNFGSLISYYGDIDIINTSYSPIYSNNVIIQNNYFESPSLISIEYSELNTTIYASYFYLFQFINNTFSKSQQQSLMKLDSSSVKFENVTIDNQDSDIFFVDTSIIFLENCTIPSNSLATGKYTKIFITNSTVSKTLDFFNCESCDFFYQSANKNYYIPTFSWKLLVSILIISSVFLLGLLVIIILFLIKKRRWSKRNENYILLNQNDQDIEIN